MEQLLYFILGIITYGCIIPLVEQFFGTVVTAIEVWKTKLALKITQYNHKIHNVENVANIKHPIGFIIEDEPEGEFYK